MDGDYILDNDIDLEDIDWRPIGADQSDLEFRGTFDGQGFKISNFEVSAAMQDLSGVAGLFGFIGDRSGDLSTAKAVIQNLTVENVTLTGYYAMGAIVGFIISGDIINCHAKNVTIHGDPNDPNIASVGGIGGDCFGFINDPSHVTNCTVDGFNCVLTEEESTFSLWIAGLLGTCIGRNDVHTGFVVENCSAINVNITAPQYPTGLAGLIGSVFESTISKCFCQGAMDFQLGNFDSDTYNEAIDCGGAFGEAGGCTIKDCYADVAININFSSDDSYFDGIGGFIGMAFASFDPHETIIKNSYARGNISIVVDEGNFIGNEEFVGSSSTGVQITQGMEQFQFPAGAEELTFLSVLGGGGGGGVDSDGEGGGGGGGYSIRAPGPAITPGETYDIQIGLGGGPGISGEDSWFRSSAVILAKGGAATQSRNGGLGGAALDGVGDTKYSGGNGGPSSGIGSGGGGGGTAGGPTSDGNHGNSTITPTGGAGGSGTGHFGAGGNGGNFGNNGQTPGGSNTGAGGGGGGAGATAGSGKNGRIIYDYSGISFASVGGFIGFLRNGFLEDFQLYNCYSVGVLIAPENSSRGGFIGTIEYVEGTIENCSWWTGAYAHAIGNYPDEESINLADLDFGTDENDNTAFYTTDHPVYAQE